MDLLRLPHDCLEYLLPFIESKDVLKLEQTSRQCRDLIRTNVHRLRQREDLQVCIAYRRHARLVLRSEGASLAPKAVFHIVRCLENLDLCIDEEWTDFDLRFVRAENEVYVTRVDGSGDAEGLLSSLIDKLSERLRISCVEIEHFDEIGLELLQRVFTLNNTLQKEVLNLAICPHYSIAAAPPVEISYVCAIVEVFARLRTLIINASYLEDAIIPKSFFTMPNVAALHSLHFKGVVRAPLVTGLAYFDDQLLLGCVHRWLVLPHCRVTLQGVNTFLKEFIRGERDFELLALKCRTMAGQRAKDLWRVLTSTLDWCNCKAIYSSSKTQRALKMLQFEISGRYVEVCVVSSQRKGWRRRRYASDSDSEDEEEDSFSSPASKRQCSTSRHS